MIAFASCRWVLAKDMRKKFFPADRYTVVTRSTGNFISLTLGQVQATENSIFKAASAKYNPTGACVHKSNHAIACSTNLIACGYISAWLS
jgi:hypothetical protein